MAYKLQLKRGASGSLPTGIAGEPLFTTDTNDLYIGTGASNQRYQKYIASGTSSQFLKGDGSLDSNTYYLASNPSAYIALTALTASAPLSYNNTTGAFTIAQASGSVSGFLSSTDWTTFNNKQNALTNPVTGTGTANYLPKWTSGSALGNSLVYDDGTNIGIGSATPAFKLDVNGVTASNAFKPNYNVNYYDIDGYISNYSSSNYLYVNGNAGGGLRLKGEGAGTNQIAIESSTSNHIWFQTGGSERMRLTSTGLGIGTTSPATRLHVYSTNPELLRLEYSGATGGNFIQFKNSSGDIGYFGYGSTGSDQMTIFQGKDADLAIFTNSTERLRLTASGNLGLGVVPSAWGSPFTALQLGTYNQYIAGQTNAADMKLGTNHYYGSGNYRYGNSTDIASRYDIGQNGFSWNIAPSGTAGNAISFTQAMTLDASGNLGVGTTSPSTYGKLAVNGSTFIYGSVAGNFTSLTLQNSSTSVSSRNILQFANDIGAIALIDTFGNNWSGSGATDDVANSIRVLAYGTGGLSLRASAGTLRFYTGSDERLRITSGGNVGIGTTVPIGRFSVVGSAAGAGIFDVNTDATRVDIQSYNKPLAINRQGNSTSLNSGGGNVLIGTATDGASKVRIVGLPTSATGLSAGDIWNDGGTLKIV